MKTNLIMMFIVTLGLVLFLYGCDNNTEINPSTDLVNISNNTTMKNISVENTDLENNTPAGTCLEGWKCFNNKDKSFQYLNCSWGEKVTCPLGCVNNSCRAGTKCAVGMKCKNSMTAGYQTENCYWSNTIRCDYGCIEGVCQNASVTAVEESIPEVENIAATTSTLTLNQGNVVYVEGHNLSIYKLEETKVQLALDGTRSDWIIEGGNFTFRQNITVKIVGILFQSYAGGMRAIEYKIE